MYSTSFKNKNSCGKRTPSEKNNDQAKKTRFYPSIFCRPEPYANPKKMVLLQNTLISLNYELLVPQLRNIAYDRKEIVLRSHLIRVLIGGGLLFLLVDRLFIVFIIIEGVLFLSSFSAASSTSFNRL